MNKYKITRIYIVEANSKEEAWEDMRNAQNELDICVEFGETIEKIK